MSDLSFVLPGFDTQKLLDFIGPVMLIAAAVVAVTFAIASIVLNYHWKKYGVREESIKRVRKYYVCPSAGFFVIMIGAVIVYYIL